MREKSSVNKKEKVAVAFISGSAGELDWVLPILDYLLKKGIRIKIIFLTRHARKSVEENLMCSDFIHQENINLDVFFCGGFISEKIERLAYLTYRIFLKLRLNQIPIINATYNLFDKCLETIFMKKLPHELLHLEKNKLLFFSEFPSLRRPRNYWLNQRFKKSIFFYTPHSPHIYTQELDREHKDSKNLNYHKNKFLLLGHPGDYFAINDGKELSDPELEKLFIGHPKYSNSWLNKRQEKANSFRLTQNIRKNINILILSRGYGSYFNEESHIDLVESTIQVIHNQFPEYSLLVKRHPRERPSHWDKVQAEFPSVKVVNDHILQLATKADFAISFWGSGAMDCYSLGLPVIEFWDPNRDKKQQILEKNSYTTIYRKLGVVSAANNAEELALSVSDLVNRNFDNSQNTPHPFFIDLMNRSNVWNEIIEKILTSHKILDN